MIIPKFLGVASNGKKIELPPDAVTQGFAILAKRGAGKSVTAGVMEEIFASRKQQFVVLDPPHAHWGIRYAADDHGRPTGPSGIDVLILGGEHGDAPLDHQSGKEIAGLVVETGISFVLEMKMMTFTQRQVFCCDFANELFRINKRPIHIFFEECQNFIPQRPQWDEQKKVLHAMGRLIAEGRGSGIGFTLISQRPAKINKDELTQADNLFAMRLLGPQDLKAVGDWFEFHVADSDALREIKKSIVNFKPGDCWMLSEDSLEQFHVRSRVTFHAGRTPKAGERTINFRRVSVGQAVKKLKKILAKKQITHAIEIADLKQAKKRIAELEKEVRAAMAKEGIKAIVSVSDEFKSNRKSLEESRRDLVNQQNVIKYLEQSVRDEKEYSHKLRAYVNRRDIFIKEINAKLAHEVEGFGNYPSPPEPPKKIPAMKIQKGEVPRVPTRETLPYSRPEPKSTNAPGQSLNGALPRGEKVVLTALAQIKVKSTGQLTVLTGLKLRSVQAYLSRLRARGFVLPTDLTVSDAGSEALGDYERLPDTPKELLEYWLRELPTGEARLLNLLVQEQTATMHDLAQSSGFALRSVQAYVSRMRSRGIVKSGGGSVELVEELK